tara:strand:+ start:2132 stop:2335 length:204 start_codon:yes stop_codon:yes gene_type:complete
MKRMGTEDIHPYEAINGTVASAESNDVARGLNRSDNEPAHLAISNIGRAKPVKDRVTIMVEAPKLSI